MRCTLDRIARHFSFLKLDKTDRTKAVSTVRKLDRAVTSPEAATASAALSRLELQALTACCTSESKGPELMCQASMHVTDVEQELEPKVLCDKI